MITAQELADHAQDAFENNIMDDPTPYEMGRAWKCVGESLFEILAERAEEVAIAAGQVTACKMTVQGTLFSEDLW